MSRLPRVAQVGPRIAERAASERQDRRSRRVRRGALATAGLLVVGAVGWVVLGSPVLAVQRVVVTGEHRLTEAEVLAAVGVRDGTPLARVDTDAAAHRLTALAPVASASLSRSFPHTLTVTIVERVPAVALSEGGSFRLLDAGGAEIATVQQRPHGLLTLQSTSKDATASALTVLRTLPRSISARLGSVRATTPEDVTLVLNDGRQVIWGGPVDAGNKASAVLALMRMPGTVFDVSAPGVVTRR